MPSRPWIVCAIAITPEHQIRTTTNHFIAFLRKHPVYRAPAQSLPSREPGRGTHDLFLDEPARLLVFGLGGGGWLRGRDYRGAGGMGLDCRFSLTGREG